MTAPFELVEYQARWRRLHQALKRRELDAILVSNPANINWLTGYDAWSFYTPQAMLVEVGGTPVWFGREMDAASAKSSSILHPEHLAPWPEELVQHPTAHPGDHIGATLEARGLNGKRIGYESDADFLSIRMLSAIKTQLPQAQWIDADLIVNWLRLVKSPTELVYMTQAAQIAGHSMDAALAVVRPGARQCDVMAEAVAAQIRGTPEFGGDMTALHPLMLAGTSASAAHPMWTDAPLDIDNAVAFELGGCRKRYNAGLARTAYLGKPTQSALDVSKTVQEGMEAVLDTLRAGVSAGDVHAAWQSVLDRYGLEKKSRIGYSIGVGYGPDWGEHTVSFRPGETVLIPEDATVHIILGMWMQDWGLELSETIHVKAGGAQCLTTYPRDLHVIE